MRLGDPLFTDFYELTMIAGYVRAGMATEVATFDLFFRSVPKGVDLVVAAGLDPALDHLEALAFTDADLDHLDSFGLFDDGAMAAFADLTFTGEVRAMPEGTPVFPGEPMLTVTAPLAEAQLIETFLLNRLCYSSLVASNAAQLARAASHKPLLEFGARRAHGPDGALTGARAALIGGCTATSNVAAGRRYDLPVSGTQAHSWIMAFPDELEAFRCYAAVFPSGCILLVDTYDTLGSGVPNAITVAKELAADGGALAGIRLDSGDLDALSRSARGMLDAAGFSDVQILASGDLDAVRIAALEAAGAPIDRYGVGTSLLTARSDPAFGGVYKLSEVAGRGVAKVSSDPVKATRPGRKQVWRGGDGDVVGLADEDLPGRPLLSEVMRGGRRLVQRRPIAEIAQSCRDAVEEVHAAGVTDWSVSLSSRLTDLDATVRRR